MASDNLSFLDAGFLETEDSDRHASLNIGALSIIEGPAPDQDEFREAVAVRLLNLPHAEQKLHTAPMDVGAPSWADDPSFDLDRHLRRVALPEPGGDDELFGFVGRVMAHRLDRDHPLWECWVVEGLADGRWAILAKLHHCLADGITGTKLFDAMCDEPDARVTPEPGPAPPRVRAAGLVESLMSPRRQLRLLSTVVTAPQRMAAVAAGAVEGLARLLTGMVTTSSATSLSGPIGRQRRYCGARARLADVREICDAYDVTVNDVALSAIASGLRTVLLQRGEQPDAHAARTLVPVSVRSGRDRDSTHNQVSLMLPFLPVDIEDDVERLVAVHERLAAHKNQGEAEGGKAFTSLAQFGPFMPMAWAVRLALRYPQRSVVAVATNIPGPRDERHVLGRRILDVFPYVPIAVRLRIGIAILSYHDRLAFGLTGDYDTTADLGDLARAIERAVESLLPAPARHADVDLPFRD